MREFRYYAEREPGYIERRPGPELYGREVTQQAAAMQAHYGRLWARPELAQILERRYAAVLAVGGGLPHLEANLAHGVIVVADPLWEMYREHEALFRSTWPTCPSVEWRADKGWPQDAESFDLISFSHVLEHMPCTRAQACLQAVPAGADILIYGPNADTFTGEDWLHARPVHEHVWLAGLEWTRSWAERTTGRTAQVALAHDLDLLVWLPAAEADASTHERDDTAASGGMSAGGRRMRGPGRRVAPAAGGAAT